MKFEITTSRRAFEVANYILSCAIDQAKGMSPEELDKAADLDHKEIGQAEEFRTAMVKGFLREGAPNA